MQPVWLFIILGPRQPMGRKDGLLSLACINLAVIDSARLKVFFCITLLKTFKGNWNLRQKSFKALLNHTHFSAILVWSDNPFNTGYNFPCTPLPCCGSWCRPFSRPCPLPADCQGFERWPHARLLCASPAKIELFSCLCWPNLWLKGALRREFKGLKYP